MPPLRQRNGSQESALDLWRFTLLENAWRNLLFVSRGLRPNSAITITSGSRSPRNRSQLVWHDIRLVVPGMLAGVAVALAGNRLIANLLFQVKAKRFANACCRLRLYCRRCPRSLVLAGRSRISFGPLPSLRKD